MEFFTKYKVILFGCLTAILLAVNELVGAGEANTKVLIYAAAMAVLSFLANNLRGQVATILGIVLTSLATYITMEKTGDVSWVQLIGSLLAAILAVFAPPAKSIGYENAGTIKQAKMEGEVKAPSTASA